MTSDTASVPKPIPEPDDESQEFFDGANRGELMLSRCGDCNTWLHPAVPNCTECLGDNLEWAQASGKGQLFTFAIIYQNPHPGFANDIPYNVAIVELDEGPRLNSVLVNVAEEDIVIGMSVTVTFEEQGEGVYLPKFEPV